MAEPQELLHASTEVLTRGFDPNLSVQSARPAVFRSSTYVFPSPEGAERAFALMSGDAKLAAGEHVPLVYARFNHPNAEIFENQVLPLEPGAAHALAFNSGMSAIVCSLLAHLGPGRAIGYTVPIYGGTQKLLQSFLQSWGVRAIPVPAGDRASMEALFEETPELGVLLIETPANPTLTMTDIAHASECAARHALRPLLIVDNTLLGPTFQHPMSSGADIVLYSATKYLSGFSDLIAGVAMARDGSCAARMRSLRSLFGTILQPDECWILNGRLPTVEMRMRQATDNAVRILEALGGHSAIARLHHPSVFANPEQIRIRDAQCEGGGAMFSAELVGGKRAAFEFLRKLRIARNAVSLGGVETLVCHPMSTTHYGFRQEEYRRAGVSEGMLRFSIGLEDWRDLLEDFRNALRGL